MVNCEYLLMSQIYLNQSELYLNPKDHDKCIHFLVFTVKFFGGFL